MHLESVRREQGADENLTDLVNISLGCAKQNDSSHWTFRAQFAEFRINHGHRCAHRLGRGHHVGKEHLTSCKLLTDIVHAGEVSLVDGVDGSETIG